MEYKSLEDYKCLNDYLTKNQSVGLYFSIQIKNLMDIYIHDKHNNCVLESYIHEIEMLFHKEINEILIII